MVTHVYKSQYERQETLDAFKSAWSSLYTARELFASLNKHGCIAADDVDVALEQLEQIEAQATSWMAPYRDDYDETDDDDDDYYDDYDADVFPPGDTLAEWLSEQGMTQTELAACAELPVEHVKQIIEGTAALTANTAVRLERATGISAHLWSNLERFYRMYLTSLEDQEQAQEQEQPCDRDETLSPECTKPADRQQPQPAETEHPGSYIADELAERGWSVAELARRGGINPTEAEQIVNQQQPVTAETAQKLGDVFGTSSELWARLQNSHDQNTRQRQDRADTGQHTNPFRSIP